MNRAVSFPTVLNPITPLDSFFISSNFFPNFNFCWTFLSIIKESKYPFISAYFGFVERGRNSCFFFQLGCFICEGPAWSRFVYKPWSSYLFLFFSLFVYRSAFFNLILFSVFSPFESWSWCILFFYKVLCLFFWRIVVIRYDHVVSY